MIVYVCVTVMVYVSVTVMVHVCVTVMSVGEVRMVGSWWVGL